MSDIDHDKIITGPLPRGGLVFEFKEMERAVAFATAVKSRFNLDCRVFDDAEAAAASHPFFPWVQSPPVVHVDRPFWSSIPVRPSPSGMRGGSSNGKSRNWPRKSSTANLSEPE